MRPRRRSTRRASVRRFHGLRVTPASGLSVVPFQPNSAVFVFPMRTAPASRSRATPGESSSHGWLGLIRREPRNVGQPLVRSKSLIDVGTPSIGLSGSPARHRCSEARALSRAASASTRRKALSAASCVSIARNAPFVASTGERAPSANPCVSSSTDRNSSTNLSSRLWFLLLK